MALLRCLLAFMTLMYIPLASVPARAQKKPVCDGFKCLNNRKPTKLCLVSQKYVDEGRHREWQAKGDCGKDVPPTYIKETSDIRKVLQEAADQCHDIESLIFIGHGEDGVQMTGDLDPKSMANFKDYACTFRKGAKITFNGCNIAAGCAGDLLFLSTAEAILPDGGSIDGATVPTTTIIPYVMSSFSMTGTRRRLDFDSKQRTKPNWHSIFASKWELDPKSTSERCSDELSGKVKAYTAAANAAHARGCSGVNLVQVSKYQLLETKLKKPGFVESASFEERIELWEALRDLGKKIPEYENCQPQQAPPAKQQLAPKSFHLKRTRH